VRLATGASVQQLRAAGVEAPMQRRQELQRLRREDLVVARTPALVRQQPGRKGRCGAMIEGSGGQL
jgi:hypothetical protein